MVQPTVWPRNWQVGGKMRWASRCGCYALACAHRHTLVPQLHLQEVRDQIYQRSAQVWRQQKLGTVSEYGRYLQKWRSMMRAISIHALERLQERRQLKHFMPHIRKMQRWGMPDDGIFEHKGYRYVMRNGVLVTVLPPTRATRAIYRQGKEKKDDAQCL